MNLLVPILLVCCKSGTGRRENGSRKPFGIRMCKSWCDNVDKCHVVDFNRVYLTCFLGNRSTGMFPQSTLTVMAVWYREIATKKRNRLVVKEGLRFPHAAAVVENKYSLLRDGDTHIFVRRYTVNTTWMKALQMCEKEGATLVKIDTRQKQRLITKAFYSNRTVSQFLWIGLSDDLDNNTWTWRDGTFPDSYSNWGFNEPNNFLYGMNENCVAITSHPFLGVQWFDLPCSVQNGFVCEKFHT